MARKLTKDEKNSKLQKLVKHYKEKERWLQWTLAIAIIIILLLLFFLGYATDWMSGLFKSNPRTANPASTYSDTTQDKAQLDAASGGSGGSGGSGSTGGGTSSGGGTNRSSERSSSTTNNSTTNNSTNPSTDPNRLDTLIDFYEQTTAGQNIDQVLSRANALGLSAQCHNELLLQVCEFSTEDGSTVTTKSIQGTGIVTSVTRNF